MTNFEKIKAMSKDELTEWIYENRRSVNLTEQALADWFCGLCVQETSKYPGDEQESQGQWCKFHGGRCMVGSQAMKPFTCEGTIRAWLDKEAVENG